MLHFLFRVFVTRSAKLRRLVVEEKLVHSVSQELSLVFNAVSNTQKILQCKSKL